MLPRSAAVSSFDQPQHFEQSGVFGPFRALRRASNTAVLSEMRMKDDSVYPDVVGRAGLSQPAAHGMQNIMLRQRAGTDAPYLHHRQHRDTPRMTGRSTTHLLRLRH